MNLDVDLDDSGSVAALLKAGAAVGNAKDHESKDALPYAIVPDGYSVQTLPVQELPKRNNFTVLVGDAASFIEYVNDHALEDRTRVYATLKPAVFLAVIDDVDVKEGDSTAWRGWRCRYELTPSREWTTWTSGDKVKHTQTDFAEFVQANLPDVVSPPGAELLQLALNFEASMDGVFVSAQRLDNGSVNFAYRMDTRNANVSMPTMITLAIPVFEGDEPREMQARLKHRITDGRLTISYELVRPHKVQEAAFMATWERIAVDTGNNTILRGRPE